MPYKCHLCGVVFCDNCRLPENHGCTNNHPAQRPTPEKKSVDRKRLHPYILQKIKQNITLKNFTLLSIILIIIGILSATFFPQLPNLLIIQAGIGCFLLAYFLYAVNCWGSRSQISALLMLTIPLFAYSLSTIKIPDSTTNPIIDGILQFCLYAIISAILLFVSEKIKTGINRHILKNKSYSRWYFHPDNNYIFFGIVFLSIAMVMGGTPGILTSNVNTLMDLGSANTPNIPSVTPASSTMDQFPQIVPPTIPIFEPSNQFTSLEDSKKSIDYINSIRANNGVPAIRFDSRVYNIGMARVNDMDKYGYMDHTNPQTGTCADSMKTQYGLSNSEYVAENAFGFDSGGHYSVGLENQAVNSWITSRGHRYNLLYPHSAGAVACSNGGHCVFLGLNDDRFGEGCHTGAEGVAYWNRVGKQPGEI